MRLIDFTKGFINSGEKEKEKQDFLKELSHEMKTPLTVIIGYAQLLKDQEKYNIDIHYTRAINCIEAEGNRLQTIIDKYIDH